MVEQKTDLDIKNEISKLSEDGKKLFMSMLYPSEIVGANKTTILATSGFDEELFVRALDELKQHDLVEVGKLEGQGREIHFVIGEGDRFRLNTQVKQAGFRFFKIKPVESTFQR